MILVQGLHEDPRYLKQSKIYTHINFQHSAGLNKYAHSGT